MTVLPLPSLWAFNDLQVGFGADGFGSAQRLGAEPHRYGSAHRLGAASYGLENFALFYTVFLGNERGFLILKCV